jgi:hypothetical protein
MARFVGSVVVPGLLLAVFSVTGRAGGEKSSAWKAVVPESAYAELTKRSLERIGKLAADDKATLTDLRVEALMLASYTRSVKDAKNSAVLRQAALALALAASKKSGQDAARKLAAELAAGKGEKGGGERKDWSAAIGDIKDTMMQFANKAKGGEGIHPDLQYNAKVKNQNGSEALINALALKKPSDANVAKMSHELELLGYRSAVIASLGLERGPPDDKKADLKSWNELAVAMRDASFELAEAARKKDGPAIVEACKRLENTCVDCHGTFK